MPSCASVVIGSQAPLRWVCRKAWRFKSSLAHKNVLLIIYLLVKAGRINNMKKGEDHIGVCVVYFCHDGKGNFLMAKRSENCRDEIGCFDIGGGGVEFGDTVEDTVRKEIKEEYCTDVLNSEFLGYRDVHRENNGKKTHWVALDFKVLVDPEKVKIGEPHKFSEIGWFQLGKMPEKVHSQFPKFLDLYKNRL